MNILRKRKTEWADGLAVTDNMLGWQKTKYSDKIENIRIIFQTYIHWYTFFWTINITVMGSFFYSTNLDPQKFPILKIIAITLFIVLNTLGIGACYSVWVSMINSNASAREISIALDADSDFPFDQHILHYACAAGAASLLGNLILWMVLGIHIIGRA
jgi:hypothetical protein